MKKYYFLIGISILLLSEKFVYADIYPPAPYQIDTMYYQHALRVCTYGALMPAAIEIYDEGGIEIANSTRYIAAGISPNDSAFAGWPHCNNSNLCPSYCFTENNAIGLFNLDEKPDSMFFHFESWGGPVNSGMDVRSKIDGFNKMSFGNSYNHLDIQLRLWRTNHVKLIHASDYCGNATFSFEKIVFFMQSEYLVINAYIYDGTSYINIGKYEVNPSKSTPYLTSADINFNQFTSNYGEYLGQNIFFDWYYASTETSLWTSELSKMDNIIVGYQFQTFDFDVMSPTCSGQNGRLRINSIIPISPVILNWTIKPACIDCGGGITGTLNLNKLTFPYTINNASLGLDSIAFWAQDYCKYKTTRIISDVDPINISTSHKNETCPGKNDGEFNVSSDNYTIKDAWLTRDTILAANASITYNFYLNTTGPVIFYITGSTGSGYPSGKADISGPSYSATNIDVGYPHNSTFPIASAIAGQWTITVHNGTNPSPCKWTMGYIYSYSPPVGINVDLTFSKLEPYYKYTILIHNTNSCSKSINFSIAPGFNPQIASNYTYLPLCKGHKNGQISVKVANSSKYNSNDAFTYKVLVPAYTYTINQPNYNIPGRDTGHFKVYILDKNSCSSDTLNFWLQNYRPHITASLPKARAIYGTGYNISCKGGRCDYIASSVSGAKGKIIYSWIKGLQTMIGETNDTLFSALMDSYKYAVTDDSSCTATSNPLTLKEPQDILILDLSKSDYNGYAYSCYNSEDDWLKAKGKGGFGMFRYAINNNNFYGTFKKRTDSLYLTNNDSGTYKVFLKDTLDCEISGIVKLKKPSPINYTFKTDTFHGGMNVSCIDTKDGIIRITPLGGVKGYTVKLYDATNSRLKKIKKTSSTATFTGLPADTIYYATIVDTNLCMLNTSNNTLTKPLPLTFGQIKLKTYPSGNNISCRGFNNGEMTIKSSGGNYFHKVMITCGSYTAVRWIKKSTDSAFFNHLGAGTYTISLSDTNGCTITPVDTTLTQPATVLKDSIITDHFNGYNIRCHDMTGWARIVASGGTGEYKYKWLNNLNTIGDSLYISGLYPDVIYRDSVFDKNGCTTTHTIALTDPELLQITNINTILPKCWYSNDGEIFFSAINGVPVNTNHYLFKMENGATLMDSGTLVSAHFYAGDGNYALIVQDKNNCTDTSYLKLDDRPRLTVHLDSANTIIPSCAGGNDGVVSLYGENGQLFPGNNYIFNLHCDNTGYDSAITANTGIFDKLYAKNYEYSITDGFGCTDTGYYALVDNAAMTISLVTDSMIPNDCYNDGKASLKVRADGGVGGYKFGYKYYNINHGSDSIPADSLNCFALHNLDWNEYNTKNLIWYIFYLRDKNFKQGQEACLIADTFYLPKVYPIEFDTIKQDPLCHNSNDGKIGIKGITGGTGTDYADWTFSWRKEKSAIIFPDTTVISNLSEGIYNLTVQDAAHCEKSLPGIKLTNPPEFTIQKISTVPTGCKTCSTGKVTYGSNSMGKSNAYVYSIDNQPFIRVNSPVFPKTFTGLRRGWHSLAITTKENGCSASDSFYVPVQPPKLTYIGSLPAGIGASNGSITLGLTGGTGNYTIKRVDSEGKPMKDTLHIIIKDTIYKITGLGKGIYSLVAYDDDSCSNTITDTIFETNQLTINAYAFSATCQASSDGELDVDVQGSNLPFKFKWTNSAGAIVSDSARVVNALPGIYHIEVTDSAGTIAKATVKVDTLDQLQIEESADISEPTCFGSSDGYIGISVTGGSELYSITWSPTNTEGNTLMDVPAGDYSVIVKYKRNSVCNLTRKFHLSQPQKLSTKKVTIDKPVCFGGNNGTIEITMNGGTRGYYMDGMRMNGDSAKITNLQAGDTILHITDSRVCSFDTTINIGNPLQIQIDKVGRGIISCFGKSDGKLRPYIINANQPLVQWTDYHPSLYADSLSGLNAGTYNVLITDANGCKYTDTLVLDETPEFVFDHFDFTEPSCSNTYDGKIKANVSGGTMPVKSYSWSNGSKTDSAVKLNRGNYSLTVFDHNFCRIANTVTLSSPPALVLNIDAKKPLCFGNSNGQITLSASGGTGPYNFGYNNTSTGSLITGLSDNTYTLYVNDENGCDTRRSYRLGQPAPLNPVYSITNPLKCNSDCNGAIQLSASGGTSPFNVVWPDNSALFSRTNLCSGTYNVKFADANGCYLYKSVPLSQPDPLTLDVSSTVLPTCFGGCNGALHLSADGGTVPYLISWKNGQSGNVANNICAGSYNVVVTDSNNCNYAATFVLPDPEKEEISGIQDNIRLCDGQDLTLDPGDWASCEWLENGAVISNGSKYDIKKAGTYTLNVISSKGCTDTKTFTVEYIKDLLKARFLLSGDAVAGEGVEIIDISWPVPDSINWIYNTDSVALLSSSTDRQNIIFQYPGVYLVRLVARTAQCVDEDAQYITIYATKDEYDKGKRPVGLEDDITELFLYPNPNKGTFTIEITLKDQQKISLDIYRAVEGKPVYNKALEGSVYYKEEINLSGQVPGVYSLVLTTAKQRKFFLFVIM